MTGSPRWRRACGNGAEPRAARRSCSCAWARAQIDAGALSTAADTLAEREQPPSAAGPHRQGCGARPHSRAAVRRGRAPPSGRGRRPPTGTRRSAGMRRRRDPADVITTSACRPLALGGQVDEAIAVGERAAAHRSRLVAVQLARACVIAERWAPAQSSAFDDVRAGRGGNDRRTGRPRALRPRRAGRGRSRRGRPVGRRRGRRRHAHGSRRDRLRGAGDRRPGAAPRRPTRRRRLPGASVWPREHGLVPWRLRALAELGALDMLGVGRHRTAG